MRKALFAVLFAAALLLATPACFLADSGGSGPRGPNAAAQARVREKLERFHRDGAVWVASGGDASKMAEGSDRVSALLQRGQLDAAESELDSLLAMVSQGSSAPAATRNANQGSPGPVTTVDRVQGTYTGSTLGPSRSTRATPLPDWAAIVFHRGGHVYVADKDGGRTTQIIGSGSRHLEHVAVSPDRTKVVANYFRRPKEGGASSALVLWDLSAGTETELVPDFKMAGNGGVDWDRSGYIYFAGVDADVVKRAKRREDFIANAAANDIWRVKWDGSGLQNVTKSGMRGEADVSVSPDGKWITYMASHITPPNSNTEIWIRRTDGSDPKRIYVGGKDRESSVHDPEFSPDGQRVVFSQVNPGYKNFKRMAQANTAHDLKTVRIDGSDVQPVTKPGPISIIPDWDARGIVYMELSDQGGEDFKGICMVDPDGKGYRRLPAKGSSARWIPEAR